MRYVYSRLVLLRSAPLRFAAINDAWLSFAPLSFAPLRFATLRSARWRSALVAVFLEHFNILVAEPHPISLLRVAGIALVIAGVSMIRIF
jgi:hypothetical protein